jgi:hypothetical protein
MLNDSTEGSDRVRRQVSLFVKGFSLSERILVSFMFRCNQTSCLPAIILKRRKSQKDPTCDSATPFLFE